MATYKGNERNNTYYGTSYNDTIYGNGGRDNLYGWSGNDKIDGGSGNDYLYGEYGHDTLKGDDGADHIYGGDGNDLINGGRGNDLINGGVGNDTIFGTEGNDVVWGGDGTDTFNFWVYGSSAAGRDIFKDFDETTEYIRLHDYGSWDLLDTNHDGSLTNADAWVTKSGNKTVIDVGAAYGFSAGNEVLTVYNSSSSPLDSNDFTFVS